MSSNDEEIQNNNRRGKYAQIALKQREIFVKQHEEGKTIAEAAKIANINVNSAKNILYRYKQNDEEIIVKSKGGGQRTRKISTEILDFIEENVENNPSLTLKEIAAKINDRFQISVCLQTVNTALCKLKITLKKASLEFDRINDDRTIQLRKEYALFFTRNAPENRQKIIFIDESGFNLHLRRTRARSKVGTSATVIVPAARGRNVTLIAAISVEGVIHTNILANSTCNSNKFCDFLSELISRIGQSIDETWFVMDNAAIHKTEQVKLLLDGTSNKCIYLSPYSPMLNPIEKVFAKVKATARRILSSTRDGPNILEVIAESVQSVTQNDCNNFVTDVLMKLPQAVDMQPLH